MTPEDFKLAKKTLNNWHGSWDWLNAGPLKLAVLETPVLKLRPDLSEPVGPVTIRQFSYQGMLEKDRHGRQDFIIKCEDAVVYREPYDRGR